MSEPQVLLSDVAFGESPRWHEDRLWFSDWGAHEIVAVGMDGTSEVILQIPDMPFCIDFLPDGRLLVVSREATPTASAWTPRARSGTATCRPSGARAFAKAARCSRRSTSTEGVSRARWEAQTGRRCSWWRPTSPARWTSQNVPGRSSPP